MKYKAYSVNMEIGSIQGQLTMGYLPYIARKWS